MIHRNRIGTVPAISDEDRQQLKAGLRPIPQKDEEIFRGMERPAILSVSRPARAKLSSRAIRLLGDCAIERGIGHRQPSAVRLLQGNLSGYILMEPVAGYDSLDPNQYPIRWLRQHRMAEVNLIAVLQPIGQEVPHDQVTEMPVTLQRFDGGDCYLVIHLCQSHLRSRRSTTTASTETR